MSQHTRRLILAGLLLMSCAALAQPPAPNAKDDDPPAGRVQLLLDTGGHTAAPLQVRFTPDGKRLISTADDRTVQIWDVESGHRLHVIRPVLGRGEFGTPDYMTVDPQGKHIAFSVASRDAQGVAKSSAICVCAIDTGETLFATAGRGRLAFAPDGKRLALASERTVRMLDAATGKARKGGGKILPATTKGTLSDIAFSPDGATLAAVAGDNQVYLIDAATLEIRQTLTLPDSAAKLSHVGWANAQTLLTHSKMAAHALHVWDVAAGNLKKTYTAADVMVHMPTGKDVHSPDVHGMEAIRDTTKALLPAHVVVKGVHQDGGVLFDWETGAVSKGYVHNFVGRRAGRAFAVTNDLTLAAQGSDTDGAIILWDPQTGEETGRLQGAGGGAAPRGACWSPNGKAVAWGVVEEADAENDAFAPLRSELDLTTLIAQSKKDDDFKAYPIVYHGLGRLKQAGPLTVKWKGPREPKILEINGGPAPLVINRNASINQFALTFVDSEHLVTTTLGSPALEVLDPATGALRRRRRLSQSPLGSVAVRPADDAKLRLLLVGSNDRTLTVYNAITDKLLLTIYPAGADWIVWTPEGYYAATPGGERLMGWYVDNGPNQRPSFYSADRFRKTLHRPDVIKLVVEKGSVAEAVKAADAALRQETKKLSLEQLLPPKVALTVDAAAIPTLKVRAAATAAAVEQPVTALRLLLDGRPLPEAAVKEFSDKPAKATALWTITLPEGTHQLTVLARSPDASALSAPVECTNAKAADQPALHVLAVGVDAYDNNSIPALKFAVADAKAIAKAFKAKPGGPYRPGESATLLDAKARRQDVLAALAKLGAHVKSNDLAVFHFAGHGVKDKTGFYLLTVDADPQNLAETALSGAALRKTLADFPCQVLLLLDACHSGGAIKDFRPVVDDLTRALTDDDCGVAVLSAAMANETAQEKGGHGLFTKAVVDALAQAKGVQFNRHDKLVYVHHLHSYVFDEVARLSDRKQHPSLSLPSVVESFPICRFGKK